MLRWRTRRAVWHGVARSITEVTRPPVPGAADLAALLPPDIDPPAGRGLRPDAPPGDVEAAWHGVVWGRLGRGDLAWAWWDRLDAPGLQPWLAAERGRLVRELGQHRRAQQLEQAALDQATDPIDRAMLRVSLAADAVGQADASRARASLASARRGLAAQTWSPRRDRQWLRAGWVAVEIAMLAGEAVPVVALPSWRQPGQGRGPVPSPSGSSAAYRSPPEVGALLLPAPYRSGSRFHLAKGCLFAGVVGADRGMLALAAELAPPALVWGVHLARAALGVDGAAEAAADARARIIPPPMRG